MENFLIKFAPAPPIIKITQLLLYAKIPAPTLMINSNGTYEELSMMCGNFMIRILKKDDVTIYYY